MNKSMMDATSGGALVNKTLIEAKELITNMAANSQQFESQSMVTRAVNEVHVSSTDQHRMESRLDWMR